VLNRARWSSLAASQILRSLLVSAFVATGTIVLGLDDTIERRRGEKSTAKGIYRDPVRSSHEHFVKASGLRWLCLMLLVEMPWGRPCVGATIYDRAMPVGALLLEAALYEPAPVRRAGQMGRPRKKGKRLPTLERVAADRQTKWQEVTVHDWYGAPQRVVEVVTGMCVWYHTGMPAVPSRWVVIRDPQEKFETQALLSTQLAATPQQILAWFVRRWQMEVTFEEARAHLGMETPRQWSEKAIARTTPCLLGLYSFVSLLAARLLKGQALPARREAWYAKQHTTFSDTMAFVRRWLWSQQHFQMSNIGSGVIKVPRALFERLTETLCYAA